MADKRLQIQANILQVLLHNSAEDKTDQLFGQHLEYVKCYISIIITTRLLRKSPGFTIWEK